MRTDSIKKYLIPNIPYLFILWACLKIGTAYRLAAGADFAHKLMGLGLTIGPAFADFAPGLNPFDWLVGIVGAAGYEYPAQNPGQRPELKLLCHRLLRLGKNPLLAHTPAFTGSFLFRGGRSQGRGAVPGGLFSPKEKGI